MRDDVRKKLTFERALALELLAEIRQKGARAKDLLRTHPKLVGLDRASRAKVFAKVISLVRLGATLDAIIYAELDKQRRLKPRLLDILRMGAFEIIFEELPAHASISQARYAAEAITPRLKGITHAILTHIADKYAHAKEEAFKTLQAREAKRGAPTEDEIAAAMLLLAAPRWLAFAYLENLDTQDLLAEAKTTFEAPRQTMVLNAKTADKDDLASLDKLGVGVRELKEYPGTLEFSSTSGLASSTAIQDARLWPVDLASIAVVGELPISSGAHILEIGQGRATKTLLMQNRAFKSGEAAYIVSIEIHPQKAELARRRMNSSGFGGQTSTICADASKLSAEATCAQIKESAQALDPNFSAFDLVFIDAPCTGTGTLRRHPEIAWSLTPPEDGLISYTEQNVAFLKEAASYVSGGTTLAYATCSILREENEDVVDAFLASKEGAHFVRKTQDMRISLAGSDRHFLSQLVRKA